MDYKNTSDTELWLNCRQGDLKAYNELFDRYVGKLHRMGLRYVKDEVEVEELVTDILLNLWTRRHEITLEGELSAYLFRAMHNKAISFLRKRVPLTIEISELPESTFIAREQADQYVIFLEIQGKLEESLTQLSPQRQKAFRLSREQGMSYADIASEMNLSPNTVKNHINAALEHMRLQYRNAAISILIFLFFI